MALVSYSGSTQLLIYENLFETGGVFGIYSSYQDTITSILGSEPNAVILTASFFDILDNG